MLTIYEFRAGALKPQTGKPRITEEGRFGSISSIPRPEEEGQIETGAQARRSHARGAAGDRGFEPSLSGGRRLFHDRHDVSISPSNGEPRTTPVTFILKGSG